MEERYSYENLKSCQSCGMPLAKDELGGGTEKNGTKSITYCSHCYKDGEFTLPELTMEEMKDRVKEKIVEFGMLKFIAGMFTRNIHKLERWKR
ncbi:zinc ribbon domain-containing protein [Bacillus sp. USDA818B3_A]|uniref:zinc ribbon domain-containing protein n=1 Tax=Bacillus sp. USDA818B3_A TaxID=2698834 RepID=UPI001F31C55F|nr:zinc ribbon domain-containing protein [Bacillus sp. USDA818B3_A]